jgi:glycosyltransferase involved in cell wall biosynthesis
MEKKAKIKVLISAYACEPDKGSEPEIGWQWAVHLAQLCHVTVVTRANNSAAINKELAKVEGALPHFVYIDLPWYMLKMKEKLRPRALAVAIYYRYWQKAARSKIADLCETGNFDILHHLTFGGYRSTVAVTRHGVRSVIGPVGGCENSPPELLPDNYYRCRGVESLRNILNGWYKITGFGMKQYRAADKVLACTVEMRELFSSWDIESEVMPNIGMMKCDSQISPRLSMPHSQFRLLFVGRILYWKGLELIIKVVKRLPGHVTLTVIGDGPDYAALERLIDREGLNERVELLGSLMRSEVLALYKEYDVFIFPSLHDTGGFVVLEAMAAGLPVICLDRGGPALSVSENCGTVVSAGNKEETVSGLAHAVERYMADQCLRETHGKNATSRIAAEYSWSTQAQRMCEIYSDTLE